MDTLTDLIIGYMLLTFIFIIVVTIWALFVRRTMLKEFFHKLIEYFTLGAYPIEPVDDVIIDEPEPIIDEREILFRKFEPFTPQPKPVIQPMPYIEDSYDYDDEIDEVFNHIGFEQYILKLRFGIDQDGNVIRTREGKETAQILYEEW